MNRRCRSNLAPWSFFRSEGSGLRHCAHALTLLLCGAVFAPYGVTVVSAQEMVDPRLEYNVKAVSLYAFGRYVTWPDSVFTAADSPFVIGVLGGNPFGDALQRIAAKKTVNGHSIVVRQLTAPEESIECHMVFVTRSVARDLETRLFQRAAGQPILLVGESPGFAERGGIINFYQSGNNVRFELNPDRGIESRLSLNAKLLSLGTKASTRQ